MIAFILFLMIPQVSAVLGRAEEKLNFPTKETPSEEDVITPNSYYPSELSSYIIPGDTPLDKIGKFFRYFDPSYLNFTDGAKVTFTSFLFDFQGTNYVQNELVSIIKNNFTAWDDQEPSIEIGKSSCIRCIPCPSGYCEPSPQCVAPLWICTPCSDPPQDYIDNYWFDDTCIPYDQINRLTTCFNQGRPLIVFDRNIVWNPSKLKVRVFWYEETENFILHIYPIISVCGVY